MRNAIGRNYRHIIVKAPEMVNRFSECVRDGRGGASLCRDIQRGGKLLVESGIGHQFKILYPLCYFVSQCSLCFGNEDAHCPQAGSICYHPELLFRKQWKHADCNTACGIYLCSEFSRQDNFLYYLNAGIGLHKEHLNAGADGRLCQLDFEDILLRNGYVFARAAFFPGLRAQILLHCRA